MRGSRPMPRRITRRLPLPCWWKTPAAGIRWQFQSARPYSRGGLRTGIDEKGRDYAYRIIRGIIIAIIFSTIQKMKKNTLALLHVLKTNAWAISLILSVGALTFGVYSFQLAKNTPSQLASLDSSLQPQDLVLELSGEQPVLGNTDAPVTMLQIADFQCPFCKKFFDESFTAVKNEYIDTGKAKLIFVNLAFLGPESKNAAEAAMCAQDQGKFWEYHDELYKNQKGENLGTFSVKKLQEIAQGLNLNMSEFDSCADSDKHQKRIEKEAELASKYGLRVTPTLIINNTVVKGAQPTDNFRQALDANLKN